MSDQDMLIGLLKDKAIDARVSMGNKWLVWYLDEWVVFHRPYGAKKNRTLYAGESLEQAIHALKGDGICQETS